MKNDSNPIIRSEEVTIDMHICAALSESRSSGEIYFAAICFSMTMLRCAMLVLRFRRLRNGVRERLSDL